MGYHGLDDPSQVYQEKCKSKKKAADSGSMQRLFSLHGCEQWGNRNPGRKIGVPWWESERQQ